MEPQSDTTTPVRCTRCGGSFGCGARAAQCWCEALPPLRSPDPGKGCYCPACLRQLAAAAPAGTAAE